MMSENNSLEGYTFRDEDDAGTFDMDDAFDPEWGEDREDLVKFNCPFCNHEQAPLLGKETECVKSYMKWVGYSHKEPYYDFETICESCNEEFKFSIFYPQ